MDSGSWSHWAFQVDACICVCISLELHRYWPPKTAARPPMDAATMAITSVLPADLHPSKSVEVICSSVKLLGHREHSEAPSKLEYLPEEHCSHVVAPPPQADGLDDLLLAAVLFLVLNQPS